MPARRKSPSPKDSTANLGFEAKLWLAADSRSAAETAAGNPPFSDSDGFGKDDEVRWQWSVATWTTRHGRPKGECVGVHQFGVPPKTAPRVSASVRTKGNPRVVSGASDNIANFAWVQHFIHHLAPQGMAGFVLANGSISSNQSGEGEICRALIGDDLVDCMVALPDQLFYSTQIPVCLRFIRENGNAGAGTIGLN